MFFMPATVSVFRCLRSRLTLFIYYPKAYSKLCICNTTVAFKALSRRNSKDFPKICGNPVSRLYANNANNGLSLVKVDSFIELKSKMSFHLVIQCGCTTQKCRKDNITACCWVITWNFSGILNYEHFCFRFCGWFASLNAHQFHFRAQAMFLSFSQECSKKFELAKIFSRNVQNEI